MPVYDYHCPDCNLTWETYNRVDCRDNEVCVCGKKAERKLQFISKPVVYDYYSENLGAQVTGPRQRKRLMKMKNLEER
jgi:putative FmdB family regulatory protein